ncbi:MAG: peptidylprolyl isomerase [Actinobacteria bacterium HGW-Actinobacteria-7]|nr:MAG: peptidylprolyl isomerase [Actinobacteria bacterium HGW-Actinobacteria-7]
MSQGLAPTSTEATPPSQVATRSESASIPAKPKELVFTDEVVGKGHAARPGDKVTINYTGWLTNGSEFGSSLGDDKPLTFTLGAGKVIPGLSRGVTGMMIGGKRKLTIQPELGYGAKGGRDGAVPPNAVLIYEVELLKIN